jgi:glycosyltransferase involved in cell wall biosynthesis
LVIDLYDNFEAFSATKVPGVLSMFRRAVKDAAGVTFFSQRLADYVVQTYPTTNPHAVILSGVRKDLFYPRDRLTCRRDLTLPVSAKIIGVAGALDSSRSIDSLFSAFAILAKEMPDIHLALAGARGPKQKNTERTADSRFSIITPRTSPVIFECPRPRRHMLSPFSSRRIQFPAKGVRNHRLRCPVGHCRSRLDERVAKELSGLPF